MGRQAGGTGAAREGPAPAGEVPGLVLGQVPAACFIRSVPHGQPAAIQEIRRACRCGRGSQSAAPPAGRPAAGGRQGRVIYKGNFTINIVCHGILIVVHASCRLHLQAPLSFERELSIISIPPAWPASVGCGSDIACGTHSQQLSAPGLLLAHAGHHHLHSHSA